MVTINEICNRYDYVLVDTCSFMNHKMKHFYFEDTETKLIKLHEINKTLCFWLENIPNCPQIFCTPYVLEELNAGEKYEYSKSLKRFLKYTGGGKKENPVLKLIRSKKDEKKNRKKLITILQEQNRILILNQEQQKDYEFFSKMYLQDCRKNELSGTDQDILISALIFSLYQPTCIISRDNRVFMSWIKITKKRKISRDDFNFYVNIDSDKFQEIQKNI